MKRTLILISSLFLASGAVAATSRATYRAVTAPQSVSSPSAPTQVSQQPVTQPVVTQDNISADQDHIDTIKKRFQTSLENATASCAGISGKLDKLRTMAGIGAATGVVGAVGGGAAVVSGFMKSKLDFDCDITKYSSKNTALAIEITNQCLGDDNLAILRKGEDFGKIRTVGSFVAGGANVAGAAASFMSLKDFDDLKSDIDFCNAAINEIDKEKTELVFAAPDDKIISQMTKIIESCRGLDSRNILDIKGKMTASGAIVAVSALTGVAGGVTSNATSKGKNMDTVSNILAVATTAGSLAGTVLSSATFIKLKENSDVAETCAQVF